MKSFNGNRLKTARQYRGLTVEELSQKIAKEFYETYGDGPVAYINYGFSDVLYKYMYEYGRKAYSMKI